MFIDSLFCKWFLQGQIQQLYKKRTLEFYMFLFMTNFYTSVSVRICHSQSCSVVHKRLFPPSVSVCFLKKFHCKPPSGLMWEKCFKIPIEWIFFLSRLQSSDPTWNWSKAYGLFGCFAGRQLHEQRWWMTGWQKVVCCWWAMRCTVSSRWRSPLPLAGRREQRNKLALSLLTWMRKTGSRSFWKVGSQLSRRESVALLSSWLSAVAAQENNL